jgi:multicomponent Na+:H+ antiporter subunit G
VVHRGAVSPVAPVQGGLAVSATDIKELLAYSTASHLGLIIAAFGFANEYGAEAGSATTVGPVRTVLVFVLLAVGTFFLVVGTVGLLRLPDVYNRMHATSKATTLGAASIALAGFVFFGPGGDRLLALVTVVFLFLTAPTGAHMLSQAAQRMGVEFAGDTTWPGETDGTADEADGTANETDG